MKLQAGLADLCSTRLHDAVVTHYKSLTGTYTTQAAKNGSLNMALVTIGRDGVRDALFCEAIKRGCIEMDNEAKIRHDSGTTMVSVFMLWDKPDGAVRIFCANVGDSRAVMLRTYDTMSALNLTGMKARGKLVL